MREKQKTEAIARLKLWGIYEETVKQFEEDIISESAPPLGACFWLSDEQMERVLEFEESYDAVVYHVIHSYTNFGELENYLFVGRYEEEWEADREDIARGQQLAYVYNVTDPFCSDMGSIGIEETPAAGLRRTW